MSTLDALAAFGGFADWRSFESSTGQSSGADSLSKVRPLWNKKIQRIAALTVIIVSIFFIVISFSGHGKKSTGVQAALSARIMTKSLPNSVVFTYTVGAHKGDSLSFQQSWDPATRTTIPVDGHTYTSIYYEPGYFDAKLLVNNRVVKEIPLLIGTSGWSGLVKTSPVPRYLDSSAFVLSDRLRFDVQTVLFFNVGNFTPVPADHFSFEADLIQTGVSSSCGLIETLLLTNGAPILIPLTDSGCIASIGLRAVNHMFPGKNHDLSSFGVFMKKWNRIRCVAAGGVMKFFVNDQEAFSCPAPPASSRVLGLEFAFRGNASIKGVRLTSSDKEVFKAF